MMLFLLRNSRWLLSLSILAGVCGGLSGAGVIAVINMALGEEQKRLAGLGWIYLGLCALLLLTRTASAFLLTRLGQHVILTLRLTLSRRILNVPLIRLQTLGPARILACLTEDVATLTEAFRWLPVLCVNAAMVAGCLAYLGWLSGVLLIPVGTILAVGVGSFRLITGRALRRLSAAREYDDVLYDHLRGLTQGIKELKLHRARRKAFVTECLETTASHCRRHHLSGMGLYILAGNWGNGLFYALIGLLLFALAAGQNLAADALYGFGISVLEPVVRQDIAPAVVRGYCLTILYMMFPLSVLMDGLPVFDRAGIALKKIEALSEESGEPKADILYRPLRLTRPTTLELVGVTHRYYGGRDERGFTLGPIDLILRPGELVFLVGGNGSGKTTLSLLLVGLYSPEQGEVRLGGRRISEGGLESYRQQFSAVFSDFYLFDSLLGFRGRELDAEARAYLAGLQLDHKVRIENGEFSTVNLSQGQRKRLALLVAYLEDRPFYVFDEWAADQDPVFKKIFYTEILASLRARGKTVVVITHDDAYFQVADRCLKLEEGRLTENTRCRTETGNGARNFHG